MKTSVIVAARMGSSRLPGKALLEISGKPMILFLLDRLKNSKMSDGIVMATSDLEIDTELANLVAEHGYDVFRGSHEDVVERYVAAAKEFSIDRVVRVTGDCPLVNHESLDYVLKFCNAVEEVDLASTKGSFPVGIDYEIYHATTMENLHNREDLTDQDREHLTWHMVRHTDIFTHLRVKAPSEWEWKGPSFTVDTPDDIVRVRAIVEKAGGNEASISEIIEAARTL